MAIINIDNSSAIFGHIESVQFWGDNRDNGYFDTASADTQDELAERIRSYLARNAGGEVTAASIRFTANYFSQLIINSLAEDKAMLEVTLMNVAFCVDEIHLLGIKHTSTFITNKGEYISIAGK